MKVQEIDGDRLSVFYCGNDADAKKAAADLTPDCGYMPVNAANLRTDRTMGTFATSWLQCAVVALLFARIAIHSLLY